MKGTIIYVKGYGEMRRKRGDWERGEKE